MTVESVLAGGGWRTAHVLEIPEREAEFVAFDSLPLSGASQRFLSRAAPQGIYRHQAEAIRLFCDGANVCMTTGTASGKSLAFQVAALERLDGKPGAHVVAIYPLKALGREQRDRWRGAFEAAGIEGAVGVVDGQVPVQARLGILRESRIIVMTPDIVHAWLLSRLSERAVQAFLASVSLVVVDEVHNYSGVFGSNAAFLFRRLEHAMAILGARPTYFCASATLARPEKHLSSLFGREFTIVGSELDSSPRRALRMRLVHPPGQSDLLSEVSGLLIGLAGESRRFLAFVDSRKLTEHIASIAARSQVTDEEEDTELELDHLGKLEILPYRAGYEEHDRSEIQGRLSAGSLKGVVSTSALELGIDIPFIDTGVLVGVPRSATSLVQRIGRVGRHVDGEVVIVNTGDVYDNAIFSEPDSLLNLPPAESALYLENTRIQYIHALCVARQGGEHDQLVPASDSGDEAEFASPVSWPDGFVELCMKERLGEISPELFAMKAEAGEDPNHTFPLRDVESQFRIEFKQGPETRSLGSLSYSQLMREAYPGAVYYYTTRPFRVYKVSPNSRTVLVRREKRYTTRPQMLPTLVFPNLARESVYRIRQHGDAVLIDCDLQIRESVVGFKERRGSNEFLSEYPLDGAQTGIYFNLPRFTRNFFTTGVVVAHPALDWEGIACEALAGLLYEAFLMLIPFERQDLSFAVDKLRADRASLKAGSRFVAIYDQTYGSLRLSGRLMDDDVFRQVAEAALSLAKQPGLDLGSASVAALESLYESCLAEGSDIPLDPSVSPATSPEKCVPVIMPGSKGLNTLRNNEEYEVEAVFFSPAVGGLAYRGRNLSTWRETVKDIVPVGALAEIPGESRWGFYNLDTGDIEMLGDSTQS